MGKSQVKGFDVMGGPADGHVFWLPDFVAVCWLVSDFSQPKVRRRVKWVVQPRPDRQRIVYRYERVDDDTFAFNRYEHQQVRAKP